MAETTQTTRNQTARAQPDGAAAREGALRVVQSSGSGPESLAIRWFTPRGRAIRQELLLDLRHEDGAHVRGLLEELRRPGSSADSLDLRAIDLHGEDLAAVQLPGADLRGANLDGCDLSCADLRGAKLAGARLRDAKLRGASLDDADLTDADLTRADLSEARLSRAVVVRARLRGAEVRRALLEGVLLDGADTTHVDLSVAFRRAPDREVAPRRTGAGAPPASEPRAPADRAAARATGRMANPLAGRDLPTAPAAAAPPGCPGGRETGGKIIPHDSLRIARAALQAAVVPVDAEAFDDALVELIRLRKRIASIRIVVDGEERVLLGRPEEGRKQRLG